MLRVVHVGLGPLGRRVVADLYGRDLGRLAGAVDTAPELVGKSVRDLVPECTDAVAVTRSLDAVDFADVDCALVTTRSDLAACTPTLRALCSRCAAVVSSCEELAYPWHRHPRLADELDAVAKRCGARLLGTGVNPGFLMDAFAIAVSTVCRRVDRIRVERIQDAGLRRIPFVRKVGAGMDPGELVRGVRAGELGHVGLGESLHLIAAQLGMTIERWDEEVEAVVADRELPSPLGPIAAGRARGILQVARARAGGETTIELLFRAAVGESDPRDRVVIQGEPPVDLVLRGGVHGDIATSAVLLNSLRPLLAAAPGLHTMATIPLAGAAPGQAHGGEARAPK